MIRIAIASGKGGTGKTFVSTNLYRVLADAGNSVGLVDCDAEVPNAVLFLRGETLEQWPVNVFCPAVDKDLCTYCGHCAEACHFHAVTCIPAAHYIKVMPDLCHACTACREVCPSGAILSDTKEIGKVTVYGKDHHPSFVEARIKEGEHSPVPVLREALRHAEGLGWDYLILDAPPGCACPFVNTVSDADLVWLVTEPTPFGLSDLKQTVQVLRELHKPFQVIVNRADLGDNRLHEYLNAEQIELLAEIPYSECVASVYSQGNLVVDASMEMRKMFVQLMRKVLAYEVSCN